MHNGMISTHQANTNTIAGLDDVTRARINDARAFRQRCAHGCAELTLRLEHENINRLWVKSVSDARESIRLKQFDRAEEFWNQAVQYSTNSQQLAYSCSHLAELYYQRKEFEKAEPLCHKMLSLYRQHEDSITEADLATALHNTAILYQAMKRFNEAENLYLEAVKIRTKHLSCSDALMVSLADDYKSCIRERNRHNSPWSRVSQFDSNN